MAAIQKVTDVFQSAVEGVDNINTVIGQIQTLSDKTRVLTDLTRGSFSINIYNYNPDIKLIDCAYYIKHGHGKPPAERDLEKGQSTHFVITSSSRSLLSEGILIYEVRCADSGPNVDRAFIIVGAVSGKLTKNRFLLEVIYTKPNLSLTELDINKAIYASLKKRFRLPGPRARRSGRIGQTGFTVTAQMNTDKPCRLVAEVDYWDYYDSEQNVLDAS
jgi:hypothetical protein